MKKIGILAIVWVMLCIPSYSFSRIPIDNPEYYQVIIYHFRTAEQKQVIDTYLENAWLPALHRAGITKIGIFTPIDNDTAIDKKIYIILPSKTIHQVVDLPEKLLKDNAYQQAGKSYIGALYSNPPFSRMETILALAFPKAPVMNLPALTGPKSERVYEYRSYESATEKLNQNKVQMFNDGGEVALFKRLNFNAVFYAEVIAGSSMPNLIYMTSFENMAEREAHWKTFVDDPEWKKLSSDPGYQHNVSRSDIILMKAAAFSDY